MLESARRRLDAAICAVPPSAATLQSEAEYFRRVVFGCLVAPFVLMNELMIKYGLTAWEFLPP